jgi:hypothetical protein
MARPHRKRQQQQTSRQEPALSKRDARLARKAQEQRAKARRARLRRIRNGFLAVAATFIIGVGLWIAFRPDPELAGVERPPSRGGGHVAGATYASAFPTSGPHDPRAPTCGTYRDGLDAALAVHALEHGTVVLWFDPERPELVEELQAATSEFDSHVIIAANDAVDGRVVATAWNRRQSYEPTDPDITEFVRTYRRRGPERVACDR